jgi:Mlc titration factor MtfA (ptsG expression regulator)
MIGRWWRGWREQRVLRRRAIPDALWDLTLERFPFLVRLDSDDLAELRRLASLFLDEKQFTGVGGFTVSDDIALAVAAQACLPVLKLGLDRYSRFVGIVMHADEVVARREVTDEDGVVHHYDEVISGEAMEGGPVMLSWADVHGGGESGGWAYNVVIHEFAHVLDMGDGVADGVPLLPSGAAREQWLAVLMPEYDRFSERVVCGHDTVLDPYGANGPDEFFAVASEAFFVAPTGLKEEQPALYRLLSSYYRQDPAG